jgi:radical SAM enzyme (TIGR01210 family)
VEALATTGFPAKIYPTGTSERDQWILSRRPLRNSISPRKAHAQLREHEPDESGELIEVATIFLTNRECPWRCLMCDLWKNTVRDSVQASVIPEQIRLALAALRIHSDGNDHRARWVKLYNSGSFFDRGAIPAEDYPAIARTIRSFERVVVECHPSLINERVLAFRDLLEGQLEIAMGLETAHPVVLDRLNKRMTLDQFARAAEFLRRHEISLRTFVLVKPPFMSEREALEWAQRSIDFAVSCGANVVSLIPVRFGNGALEDLAARGLFSPPDLRTLELAEAYGVSLRRSRVFADLWDLSQFSTCDSCFAARRGRLKQMNELQNVPGPIQCAFCEGK